VSSGVGHFIFVLFMANESIKILALSGSLRRKSSNTALVRASANLAPKDVHVEVYENLGALPLFNPDREDELYDRAASAPRYRTDIEDPGLIAVQNLNERVKKAEGLLIACPEYARGVPGAFKNALDWLVGGDAFVSKPFAQFNASPRASHAQAALRVTLETMSGQIAENACISVPLINRGLTSDEIISDKEIADSIREALVAFASFITLHRGQEGEL
jgi:NAD(P)H-dependent FMN reductase